MIMHSVHSHTLLSLGPAHLESPYSVNLFSN